MTIKTIVFDLGGVIVELDFSQFFKNVIEISPLNKPDSFLLLEFWRQSDVYHQGKIANEEFYHQACELLEISSLNQEDFFNSFNSFNSRANQYQMGYELNELNEFERIENLKFKINLIF